MKRLQRTTRQLAALALTLAFASTGTQAQVAGSGGAGPQQTTNPDEGLKGVVLKNRAPVNKELLKITLPRPQEAMLKNGLRVVVLENKRVPTFTMQMVVMSGGLSDPAEIRGLAQFTATLLREGTQKRTSKQIAEQLDLLGLSFGATTGLSSFTTGISASGLVENLDPALELFSDIVMNPKYPAEEVERFKTRLATQQQFQRTAPQFLAAERFNRVVYGNHPASLISPPLDSIKRTTPADLARFHETYYRPNNAMLLIAGDVSLKDVLPKLERAFGAWARADVPKTVIPAAPTEQPEARIYLINRPGSVQTLLQLGTLGIERTDPDFYALAVMNRILGGGGTARLQRNLREEKGYTYGAGSAFGGSKFRGTWIASSSVRTEVTEGAMHEFMAELKRMRDERVSAFDLENAKRGIIGSFALSLDNPQSLLQNIITQKLYDLPADYWDTYPQKIAGVTAEDVQRVAQKYLNMTNLQIVAVGDAAKVREALTKYGTVEVYDAEGQRVQTDAIKKGE